MDLKEPLMPVQKPPQENENPVVEKRMLVEFPDGTTATAKDNAERAKLMEEWRESR